MHMSAFSQIQKTPMWPPVGQRKSARSACTRPTNIMKTLRELSGVHGGARLCRFTQVAAGGMTGFTVKTEIYYLLAMGRYGPDWIRLDL